MIRILLLSLIINSAWANPRVVVLTSFKHEDKIQAKLEKLVLKKLEKENIDIELIHQADQEKLMSAFLSRPEALIWLSHGSTVKGKVANVEVGMGQTPYLLDYRSENIAPLFSLLPDSIQYLAVIGCNSEQILSYYKVETSKDAYIPNKKVVATWGLKKALKQMKAKGLVEAIEASEDAVGVKIELTRVIPNDAQPEDVRSLRFYIGGKLLGIIPSGKPGETVSASFVAPEELAQKVIKIETTQLIGSKKENIHFGEIEINGWKVFADQNGVPFGHTQRTFRYSP